VQKKYGVPASIVIAQAALETGWGRSVQGNNFFGVKAGSTWKGSTTDFATHEVINGQRVGMTDRFRAFGSLGESVDNYGKLLAGNARYAGVIGADAHDAADALQRGGYATDPRYAQQLKKIIDTSDLTRFDDAEYKGYTQTDASFENTRRRLREQREQNPDVWASFMNNFIGLLIELFFGGARGFPTQEVNTPEPPLPTPHRALAPSVPDRLNA
jgi:hypothetical protein